MPSTADAWDAKNKSDLLERDKLWCEVLVWALGEKIIDIKELQLILKQFNSKRPD